MRYGIGGRTVEELLDKDTGMSGTEFFYWMAFFALEPFGDDRADWHNAMILTQQANMNRKKGKSAYTPDKFKISFGHNKAQRSSGQDLKQMEMALKARFHQWGGKPN